MRKVLPILCGSWLQRPVGTTKYFSLGPLGEWKRTREGNGTQMSIWCMHKFYLEFNISCEIKDRNCLEEWLKWRSSKDIPSAPSKYKSESRRECRSSWPFTFRVKRIRNWWRKSICWGGSGGPYFSLLFSEAWCKGGTKGCIAPFLLVCSNSPLSFPWIAQWGKQGETGSYSVVKFSSVLFVILSFAVFE